MKEFKDHYPNNPLVEVGWEVRFPTKLKLSKSLDVFQKLVEKDFPVIEFITELDIKFNLKDDDPQHNLSKTPEFNDKERMNKIRILPDRLIFISNNHTNYSELSTQISFVYDKFLEFCSGIDVNIDQINRIGLRYINHCELPSDNVQDFDLYFNQPLSNFITDKGIPSGMKIQTTLVKEHLRMNVRYGIISVNNEFKYLMDFDAFKTDEVEVSEVQDITDTLHHSIRDIFISSITDEFITSVMEK